MFAVLTLRMRCGMPRQDLLMTGRNQLHGKNYSEFLPWLCLDLVTGSLACVLTTNRHSVKINCAIRFRRGHTVKLFFLDWQVGAMLFCLQKACMGGIFGP